MDSLPTGKVTLVFTDIEGSTRLVQHLDVRYADVLEAHRHIVQSAVAGWNGYVVDTQGDSFFLAFHRAPDAVAAAVNIQRAITEHHWPEGGELRVRIGVHTGEPTVAANRYVGLDVHRAARLCSAGHGGQVLISQSTSGIITDQLPAGATLRDLGEHRLKDLPRPEHIWQVIIAGVPSHFPPLRSIGARLDNLPAPATPFVGREAEVARLTAELQRPDLRLLTLTGPGGVGKTRLTLQVAAHLRAAFEEGILLVALSSIRDPGLVLPTIGHILNIQEVRPGGVRETITEFLRGKEVLLVLDNFEQVVEGADAVAELLAACDRLKILVTSRVALRISPEHQREVQPLTLPLARARHSPEAPEAVVVTSEAVQLFVQTARAVLPDFEVTGENAWAVQEICRRLDGLPLAIELAAAHVKVLPPEAIQSRLSQRLPFLTGGARDVPARHRTLRDTIEWSYRMLEPGEQMLFRRLGVFVGGFTLRSAEMVCSFGDRTVADISAEVESLLDKSVLGRASAPPREYRFTMLETIREYSIEQLETSGEADTLRRRHADHFLGIAEEADRHLHSVGQATYLAQLDREYDNVRGALGYCQSVTDGGSLALRLVAAVWRFWLIRGYLSEAHQRLFSVLARATQSADVGSHAKVVTAAGFLAFFVGDLEQAVALSEEGVALSRTAGERWYTALGLNMLGTVARSHGQYSAATRRYEEALGIARELGDTWLLAMGLSNLGNIAFVQEQDEGTERMEEGLALFTEAGDPWYVAMMLNFVGRVERRRGHYHRSRTLLEESVNVYQQLGNTWGLALCLDAFACLAEAQVQPERAGRLLGAEAAMREAVDVPIYPTIRPEHERCLTAARETLGKDRFAAAWSAGRAMSLEEAVAYALEPER